MSGRIMSTQQRGRGRGGFGPRRAPEGNYSGNQRSYHTRYVTEVPEPNVHQCNCTDILDNFKSVLTAYSINRALDCCNFDLYHIKDDFAKTLFFGLSCSCCGLKRNFVPTTRLRTSSGIAITMDIIEYGNATRARNGEHISVELLDRVDCVLDCDSTAEEPGYLSIPKQLIAQNVPRLRVGFKPTPNELDQFTVFISPKPSFGVRNPPIQNREPQRSLPATSPRDNTTSTTFYALIPNRTDPNENSLPQSRTVTETYANKRLAPQKRQRIG